MKPERKAKPIPDNYHTVTPMISVAGADKVIDFLKKTFDATERHRLPRPDGKIGHAEMKIGNSVVMVGEAGGSENCVAAPGNLYVYVEDADVTFKRALKAGGTAVMEPADMFWGDRYGAVKDEAGNTWGIATHLEDLTPDEIGQRAAAFFANPPPAA